MENVQESEIGDVRPTSDGSDSLQNGQKCDIMRVLRTSYVLFFAQNQIFHLKWFVNMKVFFYEKPSFFWDPLVVPFGLKAIFEDPQKSSMIFYRKDLTAKIMSRTHMLFLKLPKSPDARTDGHRFLDVSDTIAPKGQLIPLN